MALKHVGRFAKTGKKVAVAYRVIPGDAEHCLVVPTESLDADQHDSLMKLIESNAGQNAYELAEAMARSVLPDGRNMLAAFHMFGKLTKVPTTSIDMTPDAKSSVNLSELNSMIAAQKGVTVEDLALQSSQATAKAEKTANPVEVYSEPAPVTVNESTSPLSDEQLAAQYRSQADSLYKEAKRLRDEAEKLAPTKKKTKEASAQEV